MNIFIVFALLAVSTQEIPPSTAPSRAGESHALRKLNSDKKADYPDKGGPQDLQETPCNKCSNCCPEEQSHIKTKEEQAKEDSLDLLTRRYMRTTIWGVVGAWIGIVILVAQTVISRRSSQRQLRAYVMNESGSIVNIADPPITTGLNVPTDARITHPGWGPIAMIQIKNTGQTPAFRVEHWGAMCFREYPLTSTLPIKQPGGKPIYSILGPGIPSTKFLRFGPRLTDEETAALMAGTGAIYVYGDIHYEDAFKCKRSTRYRLMYHQMGGAIGVSTDLTFTEEGNDAD
jgi:hypothetical protein